MEIRRLFMERIKMIIREFSAIHNRRFIRNIFLSSFISGFACTVNANPVVGNVASGDVTIQQSSGSTIVNQTSHHAIINWDSFNIGGQERTHFQQPTGGIILNRINADQGASQIYGTLSATGQIILVNPAGIYFGSSAHVNVGGLIASTVGISDQDFLNGKYHFNQASPYHGSIINNGSIIAADNGLVALLGNSVTNNGLIQANFGHVVLASGGAFTVNFAGNNLVSFSVDGPSYAGSVTNTGKIIANGGSVLVSAKAAAGVLDNVINMQGIVEAHSVGVKNGEIILNGGSNGIVHIAGNLDATGKEYGLKGGLIAITGEKILVDEKSILDVSGAMGGGNIFVGGSFQGKGPLANATATVIAPTAALHADALLLGDGGQIVVWSQEVTKVFAKLTAKAGIYGGNGGLIETSGHKYLATTKISVDTTAPKGKKGKWLIDPSDVTVMNNGGVDFQITFLVGTYVPDVLANVSIIDVGNLEANLAATDVEIVTTSAGAAAGNITIQDTVTWASGFNLTLSPDNIIILNGSLIPTNGGRVIFNAPILIGGNVTIGSSTAGLLSIPTVNDTIAGGHALTIISPNFKDILGTIGGVTPLGSLTLSGSGINTIFTTITTVGSQTYDGPISINAPVTLNVTGTGTLTLNGVIGGVGAQLTLTAGASPVRFNVAGPFTALESLTIIGGTGSSTLFLNTAENQSWTFTGGRNSGSIAGVTGIASNVSFSSVQNIIGGSGANSFVFFDDINTSGLDGILNGGANTENNTINLTNRTQTSSITIGSGLSVTIAGTLSNAQSIGNIVANIALGNTMTINKNNTTLTITGAGAGFVGDPVFFTGITNFINSGTGNSLVFTVGNTDQGNNTFLVNGVLMTFTGFGFAPVVAGVNVPTVINQDFFVNPYKYMTDGELRTFLVDNYYVAEDIDNSYYSFDAGYRSYMSSLDFDPTCGG